MCIQTRENFLTFQYKCIPKYHHNIGKLVSECTWLFCVNIFLSSPNQEHPCETLLIFTRKRIKPIYVDHSMIPHNILTNNNLN